VNKGNAVSRTGFTENAVWWIVREYAGNLELGNLAPHDLRRTCARLCRESGGALEQIQLRQNAHTLINQFLDAIGLAGELILFDHWTGASLDDGFVLLANFGLPKYIE